MPTVFNKKTLLNFFLAILPVLFIKNIFFETFIISIIVIGFFFYLNKKIFINNYLKLLFFILFSFNFYLILNYLININHDPDLMRSLGFLRFIFYFFFLSWIIYLSNLKDLIFKSWILITTILSADVIFQYIFGYNLLGYELILQGTFKRASGIMHEELKIANLIVVFSILCFGWILNKIKDNKKYYLILLFFYLIVFIAIILTGERSNFLIFFLSSLLLFFLSAEKKIIIYCLVIISTVCIISYKFVPNQLERYKTIINEVTNLIKSENFYKSKNRYFAHYSVANEIYKERPIFGYGIKTFREKCKNPVYATNIHSFYKGKACTTHPHQFYYEFLSELGLMGLIIILFFFLILIYQNIIFRKKNIDYLNLASICYLVVYLIPLVPKGSFFTNWTAALFWTILSFSTIKLVKK